MGHMRVGEWRMDAALLERGDTRGSMHARAVPSVGSRWRGGHESAQLSLTKELSLNKYLSSALLKSPALQSPSAVSQPRAPHCRTDHAHPWRPSLHAAAD